jgi:hypothetical protein
VSGAASTIFIAFYFSAFDTNLVWLLEYTDITKLILISACLIMAVLFTVLNYSDALIHAASRRIRLYTAAFFSLLFVIGLIQEIYAKIYTDHQTNITYHILRALLWLMLIWIIVLAVEKKEELSKFNWNNMKFLFVMLLCF